MQPPTTCRATRRDGVGCGSTIVLPSGYCHMHDPARQAELAAVRAKGGRAKGRLARVEKLVPATLRPVLALLLDALDETHRRDLDAKTAGALAALAGAIVRVYTAGTMEERLEALEAERQLNLATFDREERRDRKGYR